METLLIVVIVLGGSLAVVVVLSISSILIIQAKYKALKSRHRDDEEEVVDSSSNKPLPSNYISHTIYHVKPPRVDDLQSYHRLEEMFIRDPGGTTLITEGFHPHSMDEVAQSLVVLFEANDQAVSLVKCFIDLEMSKASEGEGPTTLFRRDSVASKVMRFYTKLIGQQYLISALWPNIRYVCLADEFIEIDRNKMRKEDDLEEHLTAFQEVLANFLEAIINSVSLCPPQLRTICYHLNTKANQYFPDNNMKVVSGFIFLRFFTPAIICPTAYGIVEGDLTPNQSRTLLLVAKVLQNMANGVLFGAKEQFMMPLNEFLLANTNLVKDFLAEMAAPTQHSTNMKAFSVSTDSKFTALRVLHTNLVRGFPKFKRDNYPEMYDKAQQAVRELADEGKRLVARPSMKQASLRRVSVSLLKGFDPNNMGNIGYDPSQNLSLSSINITTPTSIGLSTTYSNLQPIGRPPIESEIGEPPKKEPEPEPEPEPPAENVVDNEEESEESGESDEDDEIEEPGEGATTEMVRSSSNSILSTDVDPSAVTSSPAGLLTKSKSGDSLQKSKSGSNLTTLPPIIPKKKKNKNERLYRPSSGSRLQHASSASSAPASPSPPASPLSARTNTRLRSSSSSPTAPKTAKRDFSPSKSRPTVDANLMQPAIKMSPKLGRPSSTTLPYIPASQSSSSPPSTSTSPPSSHRTSNSDTSAWS